VAKPAIYDCLVYISVQCVRCEATQFAVVATNQNEVRLGRCPASTHLAILGGTRFERFSSVQTK